MKNNRSQVECQPKRLWVNRLENGVNAALTLTLGETGEEGRDVTG
jgi:hypothetical protein